MTAETLLFESPAPGVLLIRLNRPEVLNALNRRLLGELVAALAAADADDAVRAVLLLTACPRAAGQVVNVGNDEEVTIDELARRIVSRTGSSSTIVHVPYEQVFPSGFEDMERRRPDLRKLEDLVGWRPRRSLDEILDDIIRYRRPSRS